MHSPTRQTSPGSGEGVQTLVFFMSGGGWKHVARLILRLIFTPLGPRSVVLGAKTCFYIRWWPKCMVDISWFLYIYIYIHIYIYINIYICIRIYIYTYMCIHIYIVTYIYIATYIHIYFCIVYVQFIVDTMYSFFRPSTYDWVGTTLQRFEKWPWFQWACLPSGEPT